MLPNISRLYRRLSVTRCAAAFHVQDARTAARAQTGKDKQRLADARDAFEATFFNTIILVLDNMFVHKSRTLEKKDGNPLNEVRVLCNSLLQNKDVVLADKSIKMDPAKSIAGFRVGDDIRVTEAEFLRALRGLLLRDRSEVFVETEREDSVVEEPAPADDREVCRP